MNSCASPPPLARRAISTVSILCSPHPVIRYYSSYTTLLVLYCTVPVVMWYRLQYSTGSIVSDEIGPSIEDSTTIVRLYNARILYALLLYTLLLHLYSEYLINTVVLITPTHPPTHIHIHTQIYIYTDLPVMMRKKRTSRLHQRPEYSRAP